MAGISHIQGFTNGAVTFVPDDATPTSNVLQWLSFSEIGYRVYSEDFIPPLNILQRPLSSGPFQTLFSGEAARIFASYLPRVALLRLAVSQGTVDRKEFGVALEFRSTLSDLAPTEAIVSFVNF